VQQRDRPSGHLPMRAPPLVAGGGPGRTRARRSGLWTDSAHEGPAPRLTRMPGARVPRGRDDEGEPGVMRGGQPGTRSGNSARPGLDQFVELLGHGIVPASGEEQVQPAVGVGLEELVADGRVGAALQEQADHLEMRVRDRPVQAGPPEVGRDVGADAEVEEPAYDLGPAVLAGVDERLGDDLLRIVGCRDPGRKADYVGGVGARRRGVRLASSQSRNPVMAAASMRPRAWRGRPARRRPV